MTEIKINPANGPVTVGVESRSMVVVGFTITVYGPDGTTKEEYYPDGNTQLSNPFLIKLPKTPANYIGRYISGTLEFQDPNGGSVTYNIDMFLSQQDKKIEPVITLSGTTDPGVNSKYPSYHVQ
jgi:hypothetical protein